MTISPHSCNAFFPVERGDGSTALAVDPIGLLAPLN